VIDLQAKPPRVVDYVTAGDSVEGLAVSPRGDHAIAAILNGSYDTAVDSWFRHAHGRAILLGLKGDRVTRDDAIEVGAYPEGVAFSPDGTYAYTGNYASHSVSVLRVTDDGHLVSTGNDIALPGSPASLRVGSQ
jgi:hypothetical protein